MGRNQEFCFTHAKNEILNVHVEMAGGSQVCKSEIPVSGQGWAYGFGDHLGKVSI